MDLTGIRKAIAANAATAAGLVDSKHWRPESPQSGQAFWVELDEYIPRAQGRTTWTLNLTGRLLVQGVWDRSKAEKADELADLVFTGLESDRTCNGLASYLSVNRVEWDITDGGAQLVNYFITVEA